MRLFLIVCLCFGTSMAATAASCKSIGPICQKFLNTTMAKLTTKFYSTDDIVCTINNDLGACIASAKPFTECLDVLADKSSSYMTKLALTKASLLGYVTSFQSCLSDCKDVGFTDYLKKTLLVALKAKLKIVYDKKIQPKMNEMKNAGKSSTAMLEVACNMGIAVATPDLISEVTKKCMLLTFKTTWQQCVIGKIVSPGLLTIGKFIKATYKLKQSLPSG